MKGGKLMINPLTYFEAFIVIVASAYTGFIYGFMLESKTTKKADDNKAQAAIVK